MCCGILLGLPTTAQSNTSAERSQQLILLHSTFIYTLPGTGDRVEDLLYQNLVCLCRSTGKKHFKTYQGFCQGRGIPWKPEFRQRKAKDNFGFGWFGLPSCRSPLAILPEHKFQLSSLWVYKKLTWGSKRKRSKGRGRCFITCRIAKDFRGFLNKKCVFS